MLMKLQSHPEVYTHLRSELNVSSVKTRHPHTCTQTVRRLRRLIFGPVLLVHQQVVAVAILAS
jgi:hypothetical protein